MCRAGTPPLGAGAAGWDLMTPDCLSFGNIQHLQPAIWNAVCALARFAAGASVPMQLRSAGARFCLKRKEVVFAVVYCHRMLQEQCLLLRRNCKTIRSVSKDIRYTLYIYIEYTVRYALFVGPAPAMLTFGSCGWAYEIIDRLS